MIYTSTLRSYKNKSKLNKKQVWGRKYKVKGRFKQNLKTEEKTAGENKWNKKAVLWKKQ